MTQREPSFQEAMEIAAGWMKQWDQDEISDEVMADRVGALVVSRDGARGFFVGALPTCARNVPFVVVTFTVFGALAAV